MDRPNPETAAYLERELPGMSEADRLRVYHLIRRNVDIAVQATRNTRQVPGVTC